MNIDTNVSVILGRIVRDAEVKEKNGKKYCQFSVAVNTYAKDKPVGNFFNLAIFDKYAETIGPYLKKGQQVIVEGYLTQKNIEIGESKISTITLNVKRVQLVGNTGSKEESSNIDNEENIVTEDFDPEEYTG